MWVAWTNIIGPSPGSHSQISGLLPPRHVVVDCLEFRLAATAADCSRKKKHEIHISIVCGCGWGLELDTAHEGKYAATCVVWNHGNWICSVFLWLRGSHSGDLRGALAARRDWPSSTRSLAPQMSVTSWNSPGPCRFCDRPGAKNLRIVGTILDETNVERSDQGPGRANRNFAACFGHDLRGMLKQGGQWDFTLWCLLLPSFNLLSL